MTTDKQGTVRFLSPREFIESKGLSKRKILIPEDVLERQMTHQEQPIPDPLT